MKGFIKIRTGMGTHVRIAVGRIAVYSEGECGRTVISLLDDSFFTALESPAEIDRMIEEAQQ